VAKASLYNTFGSKEALIHAYLVGRHAKVAARITGYIERYDTPRERLLGVFEAQGQYFAEPTFRGCAFISASAEAHSGDQIEQASDAYRAWTRQLFTDLAEQAGVADPAALARQLHLIYDGSSLSARMDHDPAAAAISRATAEALLDAAPKAER
jgi:AcrR family transcriptional regulator